MYFLAARMLSIEKIFTARKTKTCLVWSVLCCVAALIPNGIAAESQSVFLGPIPVQHLAPDQELVFDMHRFFQPAEKVKLQTATKKDVEAIFDETAFEFRVRAKKVGLFDIQLTAADEKTTFSTILTLVAAVPPPAHRFVFKPTKPATKIYLSGIFNGWSRDKTPLAGPNENGEYSVELPLEPGRYPYKFFVDEQWAIDPANPETEDNGMGEKNSVVTISGEKRSAAPSIFADRVTPKALIVRAIKGSRPIEKVSAVLESSSECKLGSAKIDGDEIQVTLPADFVGYVRVLAADSEGIASNVVRCPIGSSKSFRWQDAVLYYAFTDRFANGDRANDRPVENPDVAAPANFHGGDLLGIRQKINEGYFEKLGINTVWLAPLNKNPAGAYQEYPEPRRWYTGYHGYWPVSSTELDPHIGSSRQLRGLVDAAHAHGIKVIADLVLHHVHEEHPWWKQHRDWFGSLNLPDGRKNLRLWDEQQFTTWFEPYLPSFDFSKPEPVRALIENSIWWARQYRLDGYRLDAVKHILPSFWWKFRSALREKVDRERDTPLYLVGETFKDRAGIMSFVGPNMLDGQFDFPLYDQIKDTFARGSGGMKELDDSLNSSEKIYGKETLMSPLIGNHDKGRFMAFADGDLPGPDNAKEEEVGWKNPPKVDDPANFAKLKLAQAFLMAIDGVPMVYYGDEIGMTGAGDPDNRRDMRFGDQLSADEKNVLQNFQKLGALRRQHPALRYGSRRVLLVSPDVYAFVRVHLDDRVLTVFNRAKQETKVDLQVAPELADGAYTDALNGGQLEIRNGKLELKMPGQTATFVIRRR